MPHATTHENIGDKVRHLRISRGLTQEELADASGVSAGVVRKLEQGGTVRLETLHALAKTLDVVTVTFVQAGPPEPSLPGPNETMLAPLRAAITPALDLHGHPMYGSADTHDLSLPRLEKAVSSLGDLYHSNRYDDLAVLLPPLLLSAHHHVAYLDGDPSQKDALRLRSDALNIAARYLLMVRKEDLAVSAIHDAHRDALTIGDLHLAAAAVSVQAWAMMRQGRFGEVVDLCLAAARVIEPHMSTATPTELDAWGWLLARASAAAARNNQPAEAKEYSTLVTTAGIRMGREQKRRAGRSFGPLSAALLETEITTVAGDHGAAVALYRKLPKGVGNTDPSTWHRARLEEARANLRVGDAARATDIMTGLRRQAPQWLRYQQFGHDVAHEIVSTAKRKLNSEQKALVQFFALTD